MSRGRGAQLDTALKPFAHHAQREQGRVLVQANEQLGGAAARSEELDARQANIDLTQQLQKCAVTGRLLELRNMANHIKTDGSSRADPVALATAQHRRKLDPLRRRDDLLWRVLLAALPEAELDAPARSLGERSLLQAVIPEVFIGDDLAGRRTLPDLEHIPHSLFIGYGDHEPEICLQVEEQRPPEPVEVGPLDAMSQTGRLINVQMMGGVL